MTTTNQMHLNQLNDISAALSGVQQILQLHVDISASEDADHGDALQLLADCVGEQSVAISELAAQIGRETQAA
jgi:hypothetical protein